MASVAVEADGGHVDEEVLAAPKPKRTRKKDTGPVYGELAADMQRPPPGWALHDALVWIPPWCNKNRNSQLLVASCTEGLLVLHSCKPLLAELPDRSILQTVESMQRDPLPVPNLGYCCLNMALREQKPPIFTNRWDCP